MLIKTIIGVALLVLILVMATACLNIGKQTTVDGPRITLDAGGHHIEGVLAPQYTYQFILKDEGISMGTFSGDAFVTMLPLGTADQLSAKYGDFFRCNEPGALQAIQSVQATILVADNETTKRGISAALALVRQSRIPVVSFSGASLQVIKHTYLNMQVDDQTGIPTYYLTDFTIVKTDYFE
jgi:hypothetical protein